MKLHPKLEEAIVRRPVLMLMLFSQWFVGVGVAIVSICRDEYWLALFSMSMSSAVANAAQAIVDLIAARKDEA